MKSNRMTTAPASPSRENAPRMFDRIAHRYDLLNHLLSINRDKFWRRRLTDFLGEADNFKLLDLATGTGDQLLAMFETGKVAHGLGVDPSEGMLAIARQKIINLNLEDMLEVQTGRGENIPAKNESFDVVTISFGIRNVVDLDQSLVEIFRVLKPGGRVLILEFSLPSNRIFRAGYLFYFRHILPILGGLISGDNQAYQYLNQTVETFPYGEDFVARVRRAGFLRTEVCPLTFGLVSIYVGHKEQD